MTSHTHSPGRVFGFRFDPAYRLASAPFGIRPWSAWVRVTDRELSARFGPWRLRTPLDNVRSVSMTGPFRRVLTAGPPRLSLADRGLTFGTNPDRGVCIRFAVPVRCIEPLGLLRHPGLTVTVAEPRELAALLLATVPAVRR